MHAGTRIGTKNVNKECPTSCSRHDTVALRRTLTFYMQSLSSERRSVDRLVGIRRFIGQNSSFDAVYDTREKLPKNMH